MQNAWNSESLLIFTWRNSTLSRWSDEFQLFVRWWRWRFPSIACLSVPLNTFVEFLQWFNLHRAGLIKINNTSLKFLYAFYYGDLCKFQANIPLKDFQLCRVALSKALSLFLSPSVFIRFFILGLFHVSFCASVLWKKFQVSIIYSLCAGFSSYFKIPTVKAFLFSDSSEFQYCGVRGVEHKYPFFSRHGPRFFLHHFFPIFFTSFFSWVMSSSCCHVLSFSLVSERESARAHPFTRSFRGILLTLRFR